MKEELKKIAERIVSLQNEIAEQRTNFLNEAFSDTDTIGMPEWFAQLAYEEFQDTFSSVYGSYRHDGAWIIPYRIKRVASKNNDAHYYFINGHENEEYMCDWVDDVQIYEQGEISQFIKEYLESDFPQQLDALLKVVSEQHSMSDVDIVIREWAEENDYDEDELNMDDVMKWLSEVINNN